LRIRRDASVALDFGFNVCMDANRASGIFLMVIGFVAFVAGVTHLSDPPLPSGRVVSLQYRRTFGGAMAMLAGWMYWRGS
jgi:hypothetical protein